MFNFDLTKKQTKQTIRTMSEISKVNLETINEFMKGEMDYKMSLLSQHLDVVRIMANTLFAEEVNSLAGEKYCRNKPFNGQYTRWGYNPSWEYKS